MKRILFTFTAVLLVAVGTTYAQVERAHYGMYGCISIPRGDFGDNVGAGAGAAKIGFGFGAEYTMPIGSPGLGLITSTTFLLNGFDVSAVEEEFQGSGFDVDVDAGSYINVPVFFGVKYQTQTSPTLGIYGLGQVGIDFAKAPNATISVDGVSVTMSYDSAISFGFGIGGGLVANKKINIGFRYFDLGKPEFDGIVTGGGIIPYKIRVQQSISMLLLTVGINF